MRIDEQSMGEMFWGKKVLDQQSTPTDSYTLQADLRKSCFIERQKGMQNVGYRYIINILLP